MAKLRSVFSIVVLIMILMVQGTVKCDNASLGLRNYETVETTSHKIDKTTEPWPIRLIKSTFLDQHDDSFDSYFDKKYEGGFFKITNRQINDNSTSNFHYTDEVNFFNVSKVGIDYSHKSIFFMDENSFKQIEIAYKTLLLVCKDKLERSFQLELSNVGITLNDNSHSKIELDKMDINFDRISQVSPMISFKIVDSNGQNGSKTTELVMQEYNAYFNIVFLIIVYMILVITLLSSLLILFLQMQNSIRNGSKMMSLLCYRWHAYFTLFVFACIAKYMHEYYSYQGLIFYMSWILEMAIQIVIGIWILALFTIYPDPNDFFIIVLKFCISAGLHYALFYFLLYEYYTIYILSNKWLFMMSMNYYSIVFIMHMCFKRYFYDFESIPALAFIPLVTCFQLTLYDKSFYERYYSIPMALITFVILSGSFILVQKQAEKGALFLLPNRFRTKVFTKFLRHLTYKEIACKTKICELCNNGIHETELNYFDDSGTFIKLNYPVGTYIETPYCYHIFHVNCIMKQQANSSNCPKCDTYFHLNDFLDKDPYDYY